MKELNGKVALYTGASAPQGIGLAIATKLDADGAKVVVTDRAVLTKGGNTLVRLEATDELAPLLDVKRTDRVSSAVDRCICEFGNYPDRMGHKLSRKCDGSDDGCTSLYTLHTKAWRCQIRKYWFNCELGSEAGFRGIYGGETRARGFCKNSRGGIWIG